MSRTGVAEPRVADRVKAIRLRPRSAVAIAMASFLGIVAFTWPFVVEPGAFGSAQTAPLMFGVLLVVVLAVVLAEVAEGGIDAKALAMLGVLSAIGAALRPLGAGTAGIETVFFTLVLAGRVFGAGFGVVLGCTTLFASAIITGGVGPWLPYQMFGAAWVGLLAGLLPRLRGKAEIVMLAVYGAVVRVPVRVPAQPVVLAVLPRPQQLDRLPARVRASPSSGTATCCSTPRRRSAGTPVGR